MIRRIDIAPKLVKKRKKQKDFFVSYQENEFLLFLYFKIYWNQNGELVCIATEESFYVLRYRTESVVAAATNKDLLSEEGVEDAFDVS